MFRRHGERGRSKTLPFLDAPSGRFSTNLSGGQPAVNKRLAFWGAAGCAENAVGFSDARAASPAGVVQSAESQIPGSGYCCQETDICDQTNR